MGCGCSLILRKIGEHPRSIFFLIFNSRLRFSKQFFLFLGLWPRFQPTHCNKKPDKFPKARNSLHLTIIIDYNDFINANQELKNVRKISLKLQGFEKLKRNGTRMNRGFLKKSAFIRRIRVHPRSIFDTFHDEFWVCKQLFSLPIFNPWFALLLKLDKNHSWISLLSGIVIAYLKITENLKIFAHAHTRAGTKTRKKIWLK